jgi:hypothetical protein
MKQNVILSKVTYCALAISLFLLLTACVEKVIPPPINFPDEFLNQQIKLRLSPVLNTFKTFDTIALELKYNSNNVIVLPNDYNLRIFERSNDQWVEIQEIPTARFPEDDIILAPDIYMPAVEAIFVAPDLKDYGKSYQLRVYVIGEMQTDDNKQDVAAYVDVQLNP